MRPKPAGGRLAGAALLAVAVLALGCRRPTDDAWLRVVHVETPDGAVVSAITSYLLTTTTTTTTTGTGIDAETETTIKTSINGPDLVTVVFSNRSTVVPGSDPGGGVTVDQVRITYNLPGYAPPAVTLPVTLYVPASADATTVTSLQLPLVSSALKAWLVAHLPSAARDRGVEASARLAFHAWVDGGGEIATQAGIGITFVTEKPTTP